MTEIQERTVRRWRHLFTGIYLVITVGAVLWVLLSILALHCGHYRPALAGPKIGARADDPKELRRCQRDVERLLVDLNEETFKLQGRALRYEFDPDAEWRNWSYAWRHRWQAVARRCRLGEGEVGSPELEELESVHAVLAELELSYGEVIERFVERHLHRIRQLRGQLERVQEMIDRRERRRRRRGAAAPSRKPVAPKE